MIETEQSVLIDAGIGQVWNYVRDINGWAKLMPGMQDCAIIDENDSRWTLKVGVGGLVRTVIVDVHVERWAGPGEVDFRYKLQGDPVKGRGTYRAAARANGATDMTLQIQVEGTGPMAPMWEAMGRPLLPQFAKNFANELRTEIEKGEGTPAQQDTPLPQSPPSLLARLFAALRRWFKAG